MQNWQEKDKKWLNKATTTQRYGTKYDVWKAAHWIPDGEPLSPHVHCKRNTCAARDSYDFVRVCVTNARQTLRELRASRVLGHCHFMKTTCGKQRQKDKSRFTYVACCYVNCGAQMCAVRCSTVHCLSLEERQHEKLYRYSGPRNIQHFFFLLLITISITIEIFIFELFFPSIHKF